MSKENLEDKEPIEFTVAGVTWDDDELNDRSVEISQEIIMGVPDDYTPDMEVAYVENIMKLYAKVAWILRDILRNKPKVRKH